MRHYFYVIFVTILLAISIDSTNNDSLKFKYIIPNNKYAKALNLALLFIEAQRSGKLPANNRIPWRGDSALEDRGYYGEDLTGGYYDGTTFAKATWPLSFTVTILTWGLMIWKDAYIAANEINEIYQAIKWATDYFIKCHVSSNVLYVQVGNETEEDEHWERPEDMDQKNRPALQINRTHPASNVAADVAATFAAASIVFRDVDKDYSAKCLRHAKELYYFATDYPGLIAHDVPLTMDYIMIRPSTKYIDELIWAALWLYQATNDIAFLESAKYDYNYNGIATHKQKTFYVDQKRLGIELLLAEFDENSRNLYEDVIYKASRNQRFTPKGLLFAKKLSTLAYTANLAFIYLKVANDVRKRNISDKWPEYVQFARTQIDYMLGSQGRTFVVGYDEKSPTHIYHRASSCPQRPKPCGWQYLKTLRPNPHIVYGGLVCGPSKFDEYIDNRNMDESVVTLNYNSGFTSAVAGLLYEDMIDIDKHRS